MQQRHELEAQQGLHSLLDSSSIPGGSIPWEPWPVSPLAAAPPMCCLSSNTNIKYAQSVNSLTIFVSNNIYFGKTRIAKK